MKKLFAMITALFILGALIAVPVKAETAQTGVAPDNSAAAPVAKKHHKGKKHAKKGHKKHAQDTTNTTVK